ncbi:hypothetical protein [Adlercreutzia sp. ZJ473]|uniref:hypothetical protein n=1 Tax=Adlercreutzia sp. ZJ473 TaxID=2722822 RepID=UPI00155755F5|nr:hypothetical protein [Adlercreutzia sp. ZJ473]
MCCDQDHGHDHDHCHDNAQDSAAASQDERILMLLEHLHHHNGDHAKELAEYQGAIGDERAVEHLRESVELMEHANARLLETIEILRGRV